MLDILGGVSNRATPSTAIPSAKVPVSSNKLTDLLEEALCWIEPDEQAELLKMIARDYARRAPQHFESVLRSSFATITDGESIEEG